MKKTIFLIFILIFLNLKSSLMGEITILYKINNEIITNVDVNKEKKYLLALNNQLKSLSNNKMIEISTESLIREKIKKIELLKFYTLDQQNAYLDQIIKEFFLKLNLNNQKEFEEYLNDYDLTIREIKKKVEIETL